MDVKRANQAMRAVARSTEFERRVALLLSGKPIAVSQPGERILSSRVADDQRRAREGS